MRQFLGEPLAVPPRHHPADETLAEYAAGQLLAGFDVVVAAHLRRCASCRAQLAQFEALGGSLLDSIEPAPLGDGAFAAAMARIEAPAPPSAPARSLDELLSSARRRWIGPGIWIAPVDTPHDPDTRVFLLRMATGTVPLHDHDGEEITQVLIGALSDDGVIYRAGDLVEPGASHVHSPKVAGNEPCICLFANQGRLKPTNLLGRLMFPLAGI